MSCLAIGDIHGCLTALETLAGHAPLEQAELTITLGDYTDRGPDSKGVIDWLIDFAANHSLVALRGNHDVMMLAARDDAGLFYEWLSFGGDATLRSYESTPGHGSLGDIPPTHWDFLDSTRPLYQTDAHFFVHGNVDAGRPLEQQPDSVLYWEKFNQPIPHPCGKKMVCGHTAQRTGLPLDLGHAVCIDTWVYGEGWLTCLDVRDGQYWQANQRGEHRRGRLE